MCTQACGLFLDDERLPSLTQPLADEEEILSNVQGHFSTHVYRMSIAASEPANIVTIWTDGASAHNQDARFRRAGSGIFYGPNHALNWSGLLPGLAQSNQRAELFAVLVACLRDPRPLDIRTDSEWVCKGFSCWRFWGGSGWQGEHADLWDMLACELSSRAAVCMCLGLKATPRTLMSNAGAPPVKIKLEMMAQISWLSPGQSPTKLCLR